MIPTIQQQICTIAAQATQERERAYLQSYRTQASKVRARQTRMDQLALRGVAERPGMTARDMAAEHPDYTQKAWQMRLQHLVRSGMLAVMPRTERRRVGKGVQPNRHIITDRGIAMLATLDALAALAAPLETPLDTTTEH